MMIRTLRRLGMPGERQRAGPEYTAETVRRLLRDDSDSPQAQRVRTQVVYISAYIHDPKLRGRYKGLENYYQRLPSIISMYTRGLSTEEIASTHKPVFTSYGVDRSLDILSEYIAARINKGR